MVVENVTRFALPETFTDRHAQMLEVISDTSDDRIYILNCCGLLLYGTCVGAITLGLLPQAISTKFTSRLPICETGTTIMLIAVITITGVMKKIARSKSDTVDI
jgi:hypothetical protein